MDKKKNALSIANYKDAQGNLVDPKTLSEEEQTKYHLASLMKNVIEVLEMAVDNDRVFTRSKFEIMAKFHAALEQILEK